jgi:hypothetical protein
MITALLVLPLIFALTSATVILARKHDDTAAVLMAVGLVALYFFTSGAAQGVGSAWLRNGSASVAVVLIVVFLTVFPSGTFEPRWSVLGPLLAAAILFANPTLAIDTRSLLSGSTFGSNGASFPAWGGWSLVLAFAAAAQIQRYRSRSTDQQRRQSRWVILGAFGLLMPPAALLSLNAAGVTSVGLTAGLVVASVVGSFVLPATVLIAVFRHHLYDIDKVVSRTVTFSLVAMVVGIVYVVPVLVIPRVLGGTNDLVIAGSTLAAAAVFNPARRRIQHSVDRRFDRARYDSEREVAAVTSTLADQVELGTVLEELTNAVARTLAPTSMSVWLQEES